MNFKFLNVLVLLLGLTGIAEGQPSAQPNCQYQYTLTNRTTEHPDGISTILISGGTASTPAINNRQSLCNSWYVSIAVDGLSAMSLAFQDSQNTYTTGGGTPTSWASWEGTVTTGTNPSTVTTSAALNVTGFYPWLRFNLASSTGTGSVYITLYGWKSPTLLAASSGGGGTGTVNPACTFAINDTGCSINTTSLNLASANYSSAITECFTGTSTTQTSVAISSYAYTVTSSLISAVAPSFSAAAAAGYCTVNVASGLTGATGAAGAAGSNGSNGSNGTNGTGYSPATSTTSLAIGTGSTTFTTQSGLAYQVGAFVRASSAANGANYMQGLVTSYSGTTLVINVTEVGGSGTKTDWNFNPVGNTGAIGPGSGTVTSIATTGPITGGTITTAGTIACATCTTTIASGTSALGTGAISSATCATVVTTTATGTASTDSIVWSPNGSIKAITGYVPATTGGLSIADYPTANAVNWDVCNWTSGSITPGAVTINWRVVR